MSYINTNSNDELTMQTADDVSSEVIHKKYVGI